MIFEYISQPMNVRKVLTPVMGNAASETGKTAICPILPSLRAFSEVKTCLYIV